MTDALPDDELRALAEAATRGHWYVPETGQWKPTVRVLDPTAVKNWKRIGQVRQPEDAAFIAAANPTTVLALLDRLAHVEARTAEDVETAVREALDEVERRADEGFEFGPRNYLLLTRIVAQVRAARGATEDRGGECWCHLIAPCAACSRALANRAAPADGEALGGGER